MSWFKHFNDVIFDGDKAEDQLTKNRIDVCVNCNSLSEKLVCLECKCWAPLKVRFKSTKCPLNKW